MLDVSLSDAKSINASSITLIYFTSIVGIIYTLIMYFYYTNMKITKDNPFTKHEDILQESTLLDEENPNEVSITASQLNQIKSFINIISEGFSVFLWRTYVYLGIFIILLTIIIVSISENKYGESYVSVAFILGCLISSIANYFSTKFILENIEKAVLYTQFQKKYSFLFSINLGVICTILSFSINLFSIITIFLLYKEIREPFSTKDWNTTFFCLVGYSLGTASVSLFSTIGGGLVSKSNSLSEDYFSHEDESENKVFYSKSNPLYFSSIAGNVISNISGLSSDYFSSTSEIIVCVMLISSSSLILNNTAGYFFSLDMISLVVLVSIIFSLIITFYCNSSSKKVKEDNKETDLENTALLILFISSMILILVAFIGIVCFCPVNYKINTIGKDSKEIIAGNLRTFLCVCLGFLSSFFITLSNNYYTHYSHSPVENVLEGNKNGSAVNVILGLSLGYLSLIIPTAIICVLIYVGFLLIGGYGLNLIALGYLMHMPVNKSMAILFPIYDNAAALSWVVKLPKEISKKNLELLSVARSVSPFSSSYKLCLTIFSSISIICAFAAYSNLNMVDLIHPLVIVGSLLGTTVPFLFSATIIFSISRMAAKIISELKENKTKYSEEKTMESVVNIIDFSNSTSTLEVILQVCIMIVIPFIIGLLLGNVCLLSYLMGVLVSSLGVSFSTINSSGAWYNIRKSLFERGLEFKGLERIQNKIKEYNSKIYILKEEEKEIKEKIESLNYYKEKEENEEEKNNKQKEIEELTDKIEKNNEKIEDLKEGE